MDGREGLNREGAGSKGGGTIKSHNHTFFQTPDQDPQPEGICVCTYVKDGNLGHVTPWLEYWHFSDVWAQRRRILKFRAVLKNPGCVVTIIGPGNLILNFTFAAKQKNQKQVTYSKWQAPGAHQELGSPQDVLFTLQVAHCPEHQLFAIIIY